MPASGVFRTTLGKEDFKFSVAHFTIFGEGEAEPLHGHNYQVSVELAGRELDAHGLLVPFDRVKGAVRELCARLDDRTLVPAASPLVVCRHEGESLVVEFGARRYVLPARETLLLPLVNSTVELLARWIWQELAAALAGAPIETLAVAIAETPGQSCRYEAAFAARAARAEG